MIVTLLETLNQGTSYIWYVLFIFFIMCYTVVITNTNYDRPIGNNINSRITETRKWLKKTPILGVRMVNYFALIVSLLVAILVIQPDSFLTYFYIHGSLAEFVFIIIDLFALFALTVVCCLSLWV